MSLFKPRPCKLLVFEQFPGDSGRCHARPSCPSAAPEGNEEMGKAWRSAQAPSVLTFHQRTIPSHSCFYAASKSKPSSEHIISVKEDKVIVHPTRQKEKKQQIK